MECRPTHRRDGENVHVRDANEEWWADGQTGRRSEKAHLQRRNVRVPKRLSATHSLRDKKERELGRLVAKAKRLL